MISVCLATFNGGAYVEEQVRSVLAQLSAEDELVVADDGSTDETAAIIEAMHDARVRWAAKGGRVGVIRNFERAIGASRGDYIFLCDQDDVWLPGKVQRCIAALQSHLLVVTDCRVVDSGLNEIAPSFFRLRHSGPGILRNLWRNTYLGCCMAFRRELVAYSLPFPVGVPMHDMWLGMIAETQGRACFLPEILSLYRRHDRSISDGAGKSTSTIWEMIGYRAALGAHVLGRIIANGLRGMGRPGGQPL